MTYTYADVNSVIASIGIPYAYHHFEENQAPDLPFLVFNYPERNDFIAEDMNYQDITDLDILLYTVNKDFELEARIEQLLKEHKWVFYKSESYIEQEKMYEIRYETEVVIR